jgi:hypothetical protein
MPMLCLRGSVRCLTRCVGPIRVASGQRLADATGALAAGADRLSCRWAKPDCPADAQPVPGPVLIQVMAEHASVEGTGQQPGSLIGADALIPAELVAELARAARLRPLIHPGDAAPEAGPGAGAGVGRCRALPRSDLPVPGL